MTEPQTLENHRRFVPGYHFVLSGILLVNLILRIIWAARTPTLVNFWGTVMAVTFVMMWAYLRIFPLAVQDRVIRLEERMRLGRLLPSELRPRLGEFTRQQLVGLRFASDEELPALAARVLNEGITSNKAIKHLVTHWRADHLRA